jgi:hypothetical protein
MRGGPPAVSCRVSTVALTARAPAGRSPRT